MLNPRVPAAGGAMPAALPPSTDERRALHDICAFADMLQLPEGAFLLVPASPALLDVLAAFDADREDFEDGGDDELSMGAREDINGTVWLPGQPVAHEDAEPSLGFLEQHPNVPGPRSGFVGTDRSGDQRRISQGDRDDRERDDADREPSLGAAESHPTVYGNGRDRIGDQSQWGCSPTNDAEDEHCGCEPDDEGDGAMGNSTVDDEPSLGSTDAIDQDDAWRAPGDLHFIDGEEECRREPKARPPAENVARQNFGLPRRTRSGVPIRYTVT